MSPEEIGKFVSFELMIKDSKHIVNLEQGTTSTPEVQPIAFKVTEEEKRESTPSRLPIDASKLDNEEMALIIKSFRQILKQRRGEDYKPRSKRVCYRFGKSGHFIAKCPISSDSDCWGLVLKCYELRTRQHRMLNVNALRPSKHYHP